jgi:hypothetical protein
MSEYVEGGSTDIEDVVRASVQGPSLPWHAWPGPARPGVKPKGKPKDSRSVWESQAKGRLGMG